MSNGTGRRDNGRSGTFQQENEGFRSAPAREFEAAHGSLRTTDRLVSPPMVGAGRSASVPAILRRPEVERITGLSRSTIYRLIGKNEFPKPVRLSSNAVGWRSEDILAWVNSRPAA